MVGRENVWCFDGKFSDLKLAVSDKGRYSFSYGF